MSPAPNNEVHYDIESQSSRKSASSGKSKKKLSRALKSLFSSSNKAANNNKGEQAPMLHYYEDLKNAGTFESSATQTVASATSDYSHPRSTERMAQKWGTILNQVSNHDRNVIEQTAHHLNNTVLRFANSDMMDPVKRATMIKAEQERIRDMMGFSLAQCLLAIVVYVALSVYCFSYWLEDWSVIDSVYFAMVTFTTIGYGDVVPDTRMARTFTCFWALSGVACLGIALGVVGSNLVETTEEDQKKVNDEHRAELFDMFNIDNVPRQVRAADYDHDAASVSQWSDLGSHGDFRDDDDSSGKRAPCCSYLLSVKTKRFVLLFTFMGLILYGMSMLEGWNLARTVYYGLITACTVGYGDFSPLTQQGRLLAIIYIPVAVAVMAHFLDLVANFIIARRQEQARKNLKNKELTFQDLKVMDSDGDGVVSRAEFLEFMLVAMNQVDQETLDNLKDHFGRLDKDKNGTLDKGDLINVAQYNLQRAKEQSRRRLY